MTLDVKIGKCINKEKRWVRECPIAYHDVCNPEYTLWPRESYRSGSSGFWKFWKKCVGKLYYQIREYPNTNDKDFAYLKPLIDIINNLPDDCGDEIDKDRMKWLKFWSNRAVRLYGNDACIEFR